MSRLNFDNDDDDDKYNLVDYLNPSVDELCVHFAQHKLIPFEGLRSEWERNEMAKRIIRRVIDRGFESMCSSKESCKENTWFPHSRERAAIQRN